MKNIEKKIFHGILGAESISDLELLNLILKDRKIMTPLDIKKYHSNYEEKIGFADYLLKKAGVRYALDDEICLCFHPKNYVLSCKQKILCHDIDGSSKIISYENFKNSMNMPFYSPCCLTSNLKSSDNIENGWCFFIDGINDNISLILSEKILLDNEFQIGEIYTEQGIRSMIYELRIKNNIELDKYLVAIGYKNPLDYLFLIDQYPILKEYIKKILQKEDIIFLLKYYSSRIKNIQVLLEENKYDIPIINPYVGLTSNFLNEDYQKKLKNYVQKKLS